MVTPVLEITTVRLRRPGSGSSLGLGWATPRSGNQSSRIPIFSKVAIEMTMTTRIEKRLMTGMRSSSFALCFFMDDFFMGCLGDGRFPGESRESVLLEQVHHLDGLLFHLFLEALGLHGEQAVEQQDRNGDGEAGP